MVKYPQKKKIFINEEMKNFEKSFDLLDDPKFSIQRNLNCFVEMGDDRTFNKSIKILLNTLIEQSQQNLENFQKLMKKVFTIQNKDGEAYQVDHLIGMKFKENTPRYSQKEIEDFGLTIKSP